MKRGVFHHFSSFCLIFPHFSSSPGAIQSLWIAAKNYPGLSKAIRNYPKPMDSCEKLSGAIQSYPELSKAIRNYPKLSGTIQSLWIATENYPELSKKLSGTIQSYPEPKKAIQSYLRLSNGRKPNRFLRILG